MRIFCPANWAVGEQRPYRLDLPWLARDQPDPDRAVLRQLAEHVAATGLAATRWLAATVVTAKGAISAWNPGTPAAAQSRAGW